MTKSAAPRDDLAQPGDKFYPFVPTAEEVAEFDKDVIRTAEAAEKAKQVAIDAKATLKSIEDSGVAIFTFYLDGKPYQTRKRMMPGYLIRMKMHDRSYTLLDYSSNRLDDYTRHDCDGAQFYSIPPCC